MRGCVRVGRVRTRREFNRAAAPVAGSRPAYVTAFTRSDERAHTPLNRTGQEYEVRIPPQELPLVTQLP